jgi:hypothetical protein
MYDVDQILQVVAAFRDTELGGHADRLETLLADDFLSIGEQGYVLDKGQWIRRHDDFRYHTLEMADTDIRCYDRTAILRAIQHSTATWQGTALELRTRVSQVWVQQDSTWRLAAIQFSSLPTA